VAVGAIGWFVTAFILDDLSQAQVAGIIAQAKQEAEAVAFAAADPATLGEADTVDELHAGKDSAIDADALLAQVLPGLTGDENLGTEAAGKPLLGPQGAPTEEARPRARGIPANLSRQGEEYEWLVNGEMVRRDAIQKVELRYPGGRRIITFLQSDLKDFDPALLGDQPMLRRHQLYRPSSKPVQIEWDSIHDGQPVHLLADIDRNAIDQGTAELRRRVIPKVVAGGTIFVLLLVLAYVYVVRLLGEARRLDAQASQQALLAQVGMLAAGLAHEIRNPLSAVRMNLQLLEEDLVEDQPGIALEGGPGSSDRVSSMPSDTGDHHALLRATQKEIGRLGALVSDFLSYARPSSPRLTAVRLDALAHDCVELFRASAEGDSIVLDTELQAGDDPVMLDEAMLKQALLNVLKNALEAVPRPGGRVVVSTRRSASRMEIAVADNGPGVPKDSEALFRIFHSTKKGGTGLGLAISRTLVERQGGELVARNGEHGGAVFTLSLPCEGLAAEGAA
jgi:signal transduction histidine kinase